MDANRFFPVPFDNRNDLKMRMLRRLGGWAAYGRWVGLLGILYDQHGVIDMGNALVRSTVCDELDLEDADEFFTWLAEIGLIDADLYKAANKVANNGVCEQLEYRKRKAEAGKKGGRPKKKQNEKHNEKHVV